jgi:uncharacterized protein YndB with AHSA1/START domain
MIACMEIDVTQYAGAVTRQVSSRTRDGKDLRVVTASRTYPTSPDDLWEALTSAERLPRWFLPISGDLRVGGRYQLQGNAGGDILICERPRHLKLTWEYGGNTSWVDVRIAAQDTGSRLTLEHSMVRDDHWNQFGPGATGVGWDLAFVGLSMHVETRAANTAEAGLQWMMSENGKAFVRETSDAWRHAAIAGGENVETAAAAAERTTAAYTGG